MKSRLLKITILHLPALLLWSSLVAAPGASAATDSDLFQQGLASFRKNRFPAAVQTFTALLDSYPATPFRDMALYYLARSHFKTGHRDKAAEVTRLLMAEFPTSFNTGTIDSELLKLVKEPAAAGPGNPPVQAPVQAASPTAPARAASAPTPPALGTKVRFEVALSSTWHTVVAGTRTSIPFTITNSGSAPDRYRVQSAFPPAFAARIEARRAPGKSVAVTGPIPAGAAFDGVVSVAMPPEAVDGFRYKFPLTITSETARTVSSSRDTALVASSPLLRVTVAQRGANGAGENLAYGVTILNAGSATADHVSVRLHCDPSLEPVDAGSDFHGAGGAPTVGGIYLAPGMAKEFTALFRRPADGTVSTDTACRGEITGRRTNAAR